MNEEIKKQIDEMTSSVYEYNEDDFLTFNEKIMKSQLEEIRNLISSDKHADALNLLEANLPLIQQFEDNYTDSEENVYRNFNESFDEVLFNEYLKKDKKLFYLPALSVDYYITYANVLFYYKKYDEAIDYYNKVLHRNPVESHAMFQLLEAYKIKGDMNNFFKYSKDYFKFIYRVPELARMHRNLGYYFVEKNKWDLAFLYYSVSLNYDKNNKAALQELQFIYRKVGNKFKPLTLEEATKLTEKENLPFGPDKKTIAVAYNYGNNSFKVERFKQAKYFLEIVYDLTHDPNVKEKIDSINI